MSTWPIRIAPRILWCENATLLTGDAWAYMKVLQTAYRQLQPTLFVDLLVLEQKKLI